MTDKEKIREVIEKKYEYWKEKEFTSHSIESEIRMSECQHLLLIINSLQEEPVSEDLNKAAKINKAEKFIQDYTRNCSNEILRNGNQSFTNIPCKGEYNPWLTPDQALRAVEIAREEMIEWLRKNYEEYQYKAPYNYFDIEQCIDDLKQAMNDE